MIPMAPSAVTSGAVTRVISAPFESGGDVIVDRAYLWATDFDARMLARLDLPTSP